VLFTFIAALAAISHGCSEPGAGEDAEESFDIDLSNPYFIERLGKDDGYAFALLYGADIQGSLETCG
jgi:hypothetical protein